MVTQRVTTAEATVLGNTSNTNTGDEVAATDAVAGVIEIATTAEVDTGTDNVRAISPSALTGAAMGGDLGGTWPNPTVDAASDTVAGKIEIATTAEVDTGTDNLRAISPSALTGAAMGGDLGGTWPNPTVDAASDTVAGKVELATVNEVTTGTDTTRAVTADSLGGLPRSFSIAVFDSDTPCAVGNGTIAFCVPLFMDTMEITDCVASVHTAGTTGTMSMQIRRHRLAADADVLSTLLTIDTTEESSTTATVHVIKSTGEEQLNEGDLIYIDVDGVHSTAAKGLTVTITANEP